MELAATVDCMEPFVKATYNLEGDGFLVLETYERVNALYIATMSKNMPNVVAMASNKLVEIPYMKNSYWTMQIHV